MITVSQLFLLTVLILLGTHLCYRFPEFLATLDTVHALTDSLVSFEDIPTRQNTP